MRDPKQSRGFRNRNPGNIDFNERNRWQGQVGIEPAPAGGGRARFAVFSEHRWGIRALAALLIVYQDRHGLRTVRDIIGRWAPSTENATASYADAVARRMGVTTWSPLNLHRWEDLRPMVEAIIRHELGGNPYTAAQIDEGVRLAGVVPEGTARAAVAARNPRARATVAGGAVAGAGAVAAAAEVLPQVTGVAGALSGLDWRALAVLLVAAGIAAGAWWWTRRRREAAA